MGTKIQKNTTLTRQKATCLQGKTEDRQDADPFWCLFPMNLHLPPSWASPYSLQGSQADAMRACKRNRQRERERERKRERERERERKRASKRTSERAPTRAERTEEKRERKIERKQRAAPDLSNPDEVLPNNTRKRGNGIPEKKEERKKKRRKEKGDRRKTKAARISPKPSHPKQKHHKNGVLAQKPSGKRSVTKVKLPKKQSKLGRALVSPFSGPRTKAFQGKNVTSPNPRITIQSSVPKTL